MMKRIIALLLLGISAACYGQDFRGRYTDSLDNLIHVSDNDSTKAIASFLIFDQWRHSDSAKAARYLEQGKQYSQKNPFLQAVAVYYSAKQIAYRLPDSARTLFLKVEKLLQRYPTNKALSMRAYCWHDYGLLFQYPNDDLKSYIDILLNKSLPLAQQAGDSLYTGKLYLDLSFGFKNLEEFAQAEAFLKKSIAVLKKTPGSFEWLASAYHTLSETYSFTQRPALAGPLLDSMYTLLLPYPDDEAWLDYYAGKAAQLTVSEKFDHSLLVADKGILLARKLKQAYSEQRLMLQKYYALFEKGDYVAARDIAIDLSTRRPFMDAVTNEVQLYFQLAKTHEKLHRYEEAYHWLSKYTDLNNSISESNLKTAVNALEIKYRNAENQKKISELKATNAKAAYDIKSSRMLSWILGLASLLLSVLLALGYLFYKNKKKSMAQQEKIRLTETMLTAQEEERTRVARDLHDGLGGMLSGIKMNLELLAADSQDSRTQATLKDLTGQMGGSLHELRQIAHNMMPEALLRQGLQAALTDLCHSLRTPEFDIQYQLSSIQPAIPVQKQLIIYRIVQELFTNVIRHARAHHIFLQCTQDADVFFITVEDDGVGFTRQDRQGAMGMGLKNIAHRIDYLDGSMDITSPAGKPGTSINIQLNVRS